MPIHLIAIGGAVGVVTLGITAHAALKKRNAKKRFEAKKEGTQRIEEETKNVHRDFTTASETLGRTRVKATETLQQAADYLRGIAKQYDLEAIPEIPDEVLAEWTELEQDIKVSLGVSTAAGATSGVAAATPSALYTAAGLFGVASTGTRISTLSGAANEAARLAWLGGGALTSGGGGIAAGATILNVASRANIVLAPIALATALWSEKKAHEAEQEVNEKIGQLNQTEAKLGLKASTMRTAMLRIKELKTGIENGDKAVQDLLAKARALPLPALNAPEGSVNVPVEPDLHLPHQVYLGAKTLRSLIEEPALNSAQRAILEQEI